MNNKTHVFSCWVKKDVPIIKRRQWWNIFGKDEISYENQLVRFSLSDLTEDQVKTIQQANFITDIWPNLFLRVIGENISDAQLASGDIYFYPYLK